MGQMLIRNLDDQVIAGLKRRAEQNRTSAEEEARRALTASAGFDADAWREETRKFREAIGPLPPGPSSLDLLRADRDRDNLP